MSVLDALEAYEATRSAVEGDASVETLIQLQSRGGLDWPISGDELKKITRAPSP